MTKQTFFTIIAMTTISLFSSCNSSNKQAQKLYQEAEKLYQTHQFNMAKLQIDSLMKQYPNNIEYTTRSKELMREINIAEQQNNLHYLDSLIALKDTTLKPLLANFEETEEGSIKNLIHKKQKSINSFSRNYLRPVLDTEGNFYISSYYCGGSYINHNQIKVTSANASATSEVIENDGFNNRQFNDGTFYWEVVQYKTGKDNGVIDFIAQHADQTINVQYIGKRNQVIAMEKPDKEAIRDGYEISFLLKEIASLKKEKENAQKELQRLGASQQQNQPLKKEIQ